MLSHPNITADTIIPEEFETLLTKIEELAELSPQLKRTGYVQKLRVMAPQLTLLNPLQDPPPWLELSRLIDDIKVKILLATSLLELQATSFSLDRAICTPESCPSGTTQADVDAVLIAAATADIATAIAQGVAAAIPQEILGTANPAYIIALVIATALDVVAKGLTLSAVILQKEVNEINACQEAAFQQVVYSMCGTINEIKASLDNLHTKVDLLDRKINILLSLVVELKALTEEILLREIEENLAECHILTSLYLPVAEGGRLETVQNLIQSLINASTITGNSIGAAESYLKQGIAATLKKEYCRALQWFTLAYKQLTTNACCQNLESPTSSED